jgi:hypothetical protein
MEDEELLWRRPGFRGQGILAKAVEPPEPDLVFLASARWMTTAAWPPRPRPSSGYAPVLPGHQGGTGRGSHQPCSVPSRARPWCWRPSCPACSPPSGPERAPLRLPARHHEGQEKALWTPRPLADLGWSGMTTWRSPPSIPPPQRAPVWSSRARPRRRWPPTWPRLCARTPRLSRTGVRQVNLRLFLL